MKTVMFAVIVVVLALAGRADAYPQYQMSRDQMCTSCHLTPDGGGLLSENGLNTAEVTSTWGHNPNFMYEKVKLPTWLVVGGDFRGMWGYLQAPQRYLYGFPMQGDIYGAAYVGNVSVQATVGMRPAQEGNEALTRVWAREHFIQWQTERGAAEGLFVRVGHFMPVFGLRWVEHPQYVRRYGGTPLFSETYGASASYIKEKFEAHVSGFIENPLMDGVQLSNGGAAYGEYRLTDKTLVGAGAMVTFNDFNHTYRGVLTAKQYIPSPGILLQGELQLANPHVDGAGGVDYGYKQLVGQFMASYFVNDAIFVDVGFGHYDQNIRVSELDRTAFDVNIHWFATSHIELMLVNRYELIGFGSGGPSGAWSFLQAHYRL